MSPSLTDPAAAASLTPDEWLALHVPRYAAVASAYMIYEDFLKLALQQIARRAAPLAVVEVRAKDLPSFAGKILRKRDTYQTAADPQPPDPLIRLTDLCGGRIICQTSAHVTAVCRIIEKAFVIDWANSEDVSQRLKPAEFGYRSVHYIVQVDSALLAAAGLDLAVPPELAGFAAATIGDHAAGIPLKAEIQVRTLLEHTSSCIGHEWIYKSELKMPARVKRRHSALAAVLESADREITRLVGEFETFESNSCTWLSPEEMKREIANARVMLGLPESLLPLAEKRPVAVRAAKLALTSGDQALAVDILGPFAASDDPAVLRTLGHALVSRHWMDPNHAEFQTGETLLRQATTLVAHDAETLCLRAECAALRCDDEQARALFQQAAAADGTEPLTLARHLEFEAAHQDSPIPLRLAIPMIHMAITRAKAQIEANANLAAAWSSLALFHLFLGEPYAALDALARLARLCRDDCADDPATHPAGPCAAGRALLRLRASTLRLAGLHHSLTGFWWFERFLLLVLATRVKDAHAHADLTARASWQTTAPPAAPHFAPDDSVVILAGGCAADVEPLMPALRKLLERAYANLSFTLVCGGTRSGISGVAGSLAADSGGRVRAVGYLPSSLPRGSNEDTERFPLRFSSPGTADFTPLDPLQAWTDIIAAGLDPRRVKVLCHAPGDIARAECVIAITLGARVGVLLDPALSRARQFDAAAWEPCGNLLQLPLDPMTVRAFLQIDPLPLPKADLVRLEPAARQAHEAYTASARPTDDSMQPWENLTPDLKLSNYHQVAYWEKTLAGFGLGIRPLTDEDRLQPTPAMADLLGDHPGADPIAELAELEHGRWNIERLGRGWRYAAEKNIAEKQSPWLIPWGAVPEYIQQYDVNAIIALPSTMREVGLELYRLEG